jgi:hypothetical protein
MPKLPPGLSDAPRNGSDRIGPTHADRATAGMADLLVMCERISRIEAEQADVIASPASVVRFPNAMIESLLAFAGKLLVLKRVYEARDDRRS